MVDLVLQRKLNKCQRDLDSQLKEAVVEPIQLIQPF